MLNVLVMFQVRQRIPGINPYVECFGHVSSQTENTRNKSASFPHFDMGMRPLFPVFPLLKLWITESPKIFKQILENLFVITKMAHLPMEPNGRGNDLKMASIFSFLKNVTF